MISRLTTALLTLGLLSLVTARPVSHEEAKKQDISIDDLITDKEIDEIFKRLFPSSNAEGQGVSVSKGYFSFPMHGIKYEWGKEQGRRIPFSETQGTSQNTKEQGLTITLPDSNTLELGEEQGRRVILPKEQSYTRNDLEDFLNGLFQPSKTVKEQGISITLPDENSFEFGKEQGRRVGWSHEQGRRVGWSHEQGRRVPFGEQQGIRAGWGKEQGLRRRVAWGEQQGAKPVYSIKEQNPLNPWLGYQYPFTNEQGIRVIPSAKQQSLFRYNPGFNPFYAKQQGRRIIPTTEQQDIQYPLYYYNTPISSKDKNIRPATESIYNTAVIEALCNAASDKEKAAVVASYVDDLFDNFQGFTDICDLLNGSGANGSTGKNAKGLSKELNKLLKDEK